MAIKIIQYILTHPCFVPLYLSTSNIGSRRRDLVLVGSGSLPRFDCYPHLSVGCSSILDVEEQSHTDNENCSLFQTIRRRR